MFFCEIDATGNIFKFRIIDLVQTLYFTESSFDGSSKLFRSERFSDVTFCVEGEKIPAHKAILAMRCEYFSAMFDSGLRNEPDDDVVKLDVPLKEFNIILEYIYTGSLKAEDEEEVLQILSLSQEYLLSDLSMKIGEKLEPKITLENVFKIVKFSNALGLEFIFQSCCKFINKNLKAVFESVRVNELTTKAWECILEMRAQGNDDSRSVTEIEIFKYILKWTEYNSDKFETEDIPLIFGKIRLNLIDIADLIRVVRKSNIYDSGYILDAIEKKYSPENHKCHYCRNYICG